jgi:hypothetical protein
VDRYPWLQSPCRALAWLDGNGFERPSFVCFGGGQPCTAGPAVVSLKMEVV